MTRVTDPVCGMEIDPGQAVQATVESRSFHFCSEHCRRAFQEDPERYAGMERHEPPYTATERTAAPKFGAAGSGGLEHEPTPERHRRE